MEQSKLTPVRAFFSDGIFERFSLQLAMQKSQGLRNVMDNVRVHEVAFTAAAATDQFDTMHLRIHASATVYQIKDDTGSGVPGTRRDASEQDGRLMHQ
jgi:hypothetical protein